MSNKVCGGGHVLLGSTAGKKFCISSSCGIAAHRGAPVPDFLVARNSTKGQLFIGVPNAGNSQKEEVYAAAPVLLVVGLGSQLQSMMTDKAPVATWEGASSVDKCGHLFIGLTTKKKPRFCQSGKAFTKLNWCNC